MARYNLIDTKWRSNHSQMALGSAPTSNLLESLVQKKVSGDRQREMTNEICLTAAELNFWNMFQKVKQY